MGFFDKGVDQTEFDGFKSDVQSKFTALHEEVQRKATDSEETAHTAAANALESEKRIKATESSVGDALNALESYRDQAKNELLKIQTETESLEANNKNLLLNIEDTKRFYVELVESKKSVESATAEVSKNIEKINTAVAASEKLPEDVANIGKLLENTKSLGDNMQGLLSHSMTKKSEIDDLYNKILGYEIKNNEGNIERVDGLRDKLEKSYGGIETKAVELEKEIQRLVDFITENHESQLSQHKKSFEDLVSKSNIRIAAVNDQLTGLLPGSMAEGLSAAYEKKKDDEIRSLEKFETNFKIAIGLMVLVSLIPFFVDIYLLTSKGVELVKVIKDTPSLIVAILPLYFPVLWLAYSLNKKLNLSKRLIEEYTHKAVLGKTFSGLSNQIETLPREGAVKDELRTRLLFNLLQVSSENPGKLITDYNKSDHPLMEALENSIKLSDSMGALAKLPGFSAITKSIAAKSEKILKSETQKIEDGLAVQESLENDTDRSPAQVG